MTDLSPIVRIETPRGARDLPEEAAVALVYNGTTQAVMMATPVDIADLARGFTLTEGIAALDEIEGPEVICHDLGIEARIWLPASRQAALTARRRALVGAVGCGLCGIDSLEAATRPLPPLPAPAGPVMTAAEATDALDRLRAHQPLHDATRAVHAAGLWLSGRGIACAREDVGRHNALDKLAGAVALAGLAPADGAIVLTSRLSVEMVQKTVMTGAPVLLSVSAPTAAAVRIARSARLTLASTAGGRLLTYTHPERIAP